MEPKRRDDAIPEPGALPDAAIVGPDTRRANRETPNQARAKKRSVFDAHGARSNSMDDWKLETGLLMRSKLSLEWRAFGKLPRAGVFADMHCVTPWSRLGDPRNEDPR